MDVVFGHRCGIDVHRKMATACILVGAAGAKAKQATQSFPTVAQGLTALGFWLVRNKVTHVVMESAAVVLETRL